MNGLDYGSMRLWQRKLQQSERTVDQFIQKFLLEQALEALAGEIALAGAAGDAEYPGVDRISYDSRTGQVQFECGVSGFASQTSYNGFYYSPGDVPLGFGGTGDMTLAPSGAGWCWEETEGDNWYYTERLRSGWYYYEMHF